MHQLAMLSTVFQPALPAYVTCQSGIARGETSLEMDQSLILSMLLGVVPNKKVDEDKFLLLIIV